MKRYYPVPIPTISANNFIFELSHSNFIPGDKFSFELKHKELLDLTDAVSIGLRQDRYYTECKGKKRIPMSKLRSYYFSLENYGFQFSKLGNSCSGILEIPTTIPGTMKSSQIPLRLSPSEIITEIQYALTIYVCTDPFGDGRGIEEFYPIEIGVTRKGSNVNLGNIQSVVHEIPYIQEQENLKFDEERLNQQQKKEEEQQQQYRIGSEMITSNSGTTIGFGKSNNDGPPHYSMLSLPIVGSSRSNSVETLPPHYEDISEYDWRMKHFDSYRELM